MKIIRGMEIILIEEDLKKQPEKRQKMKHSRDGTNNEWKGMSVEVL